MLRPFGLDGKPTLLKMVQETGSGLAAKVSVLTDPSFYASSSFACPSLTTLGQFRSPNYLCTYKNLQFSIRLSHYVV